MSKSSQSENKSGSMGSAIMALLFQPIKLMFLLLVALLRVPFQALLMWLKEANEKRAREAQAKNDGKDATTKR